jgi:hypothetical protein
MSVDCWACIDANPNQMDAWEFHIPSPFIDFGDSRDGNHEELAKLNGFQITNELIDQLLQLPNSSMESPESIRQFFEEHKGRKVYFTFV